MLSDFVLLSLYLREGKKMGDEGMGERNGMTAVDETECYMDGFWGGYKLTPLDSYI